MRSVAARGCLLVLVAGLSAGCGGEKDAPPKYSVSGDVKFAGVPISKGTILFLPEDGQGTVDAGNIVDGKYSFKAAAGKKKVQIRASIESEPKKPGEKGAQPKEIYMPTPSVTELVPDDYNINSKLTAEVKTAGENKFDFDLK